MSRQDATKRVFQSKTEYVTDGLRQMIVDGDLAPGQTLRQRELAELFGVSATPVREALNRLAAEGYVASETHHGSTVVVRTGRDRVSENFRIRNSLEGLATELAVAKMSDEVLADLQRINDEMAKFSGNDAQNENRRSELNRRFHFTIYEAAESPILLSLLKLLWDGLVQAPGRGRPVEEAIAEHQAIIDALGKGDAVAASRLVGSHIISGVEYQDEYGTSDR